MWQFNTAISENTVAFNPFQLVFSLVQWCRLFYLPQRSCDQGYVFTRVCDSVHRGGCLPQCMLGYPPPSRPPPRSRHLPEQAPPKEQAPPQEQAPPLGTGTPPGAGTPPAYGQWAAGTHPTGMHSCLKKFDDMSHFSGATDTPVLDFWWHLPWVSKPEWIPSLTCVLACVQRIPHIHLWCDTCSPLSFSMLQSSFSQTTRNWQ